MTAAGQSALNVPGHTVVIYESATATWSSAGGRAAQTVPGRKRDRRWPAGPWTGDQRRSYHMATGPGLRASRNTPRVPAWPATPSGWRYLGAIGSMHGTRPAGPAGSTPNAHAAMLNSSGPGEGGRLTAYGREFEEMPVGGPGASVCPRRGRAAAVVAAAPTSIAPRMNREDARPERRYRQRQ